MYDTSSVLEVLDQLPLAFLVSGVAVFIGFYAYYIESIRLAKKQKSFTTPVLGNMVNFAHDIVFISMFSHWFYEIDHIIFKLFWVGLVIYTGMEIIVHIQTIKYGRQELAPSLTQTQFVVGYIAAQIGVTFIFIFMMSLIPADDLFLIKFSLAVICIVVSGFLFNHRRQGRGSSLVQASSLLAGGTVMFFGFLPALSPYFENGYYRAAGAVVVLSALLNVIIVWNNGPSSRDRERVQA